MNHNLNQAKYLIKRMMNANEEILILKTKFSKNLEELVHQSTSEKVTWTNFIKNNFKENVHYIVEKIKPLKKKNGGNNKISYFLTEETFELSKNTFNLKNRYIRQIGNSQHVNIMMSLENQTIGFIENSFKKSIEVVRQKTFNLYRVDLYFPLYNLIIECDENGHKNRCEIYEENREKYILSLGNTFIRFNPNDEMFDLSIVISEIHKVMFSKEKISNSVIVVNFCE